MFEKNEERREVEEKLKVKGGEGGLRGFFSRLREARESESVRVPVAGETGV